uniref:Uncharacterized protein n=1 Tax=Acrobeloides nanus TaxID=290746 RepID=A0A914DAC4_9BILA
MYASFYPNSSKYFIRQLTYVMESGNSNSEMVKLSKNEKTDEKYYLSEFGSDVTYHEYTGKTKALFLGSFVNQICEVLGTKFPITKEIVLKIQWNIEHIFNTYRIPLK